MRSHINITNKLFETPNEGVDHINMTVPLFLRCLEWAKESAKTDVELHELVENILSKDSVLDIEDYLSIVPTGSEAEPKED